MNKNYITMFISIIMLTCIQIQSSDDQDNYNPDIYDNNINAIIFEPADEFKSPEMVGQYYKAGATATINNPRQSNYTVIFVFENVIEEHGNIPDDLTYIGSYTSDEDAVTMHLYGILRDPLWN